jgi:sortase (surface protein transpeptidase)
VPAGSPGTYWLAAHHATHGSPFGNLPSVRPGAKVIITTASGHTYTYTVTSLEEVGVTATYETVYGPDTTTARILLQTCDGATHRVLVHGVLTSAS